MANPCWDKILNGSPEIVSYLKNKTGIDYNPTTKEGRDEYIKAAKELQDHSVNTIKNIFSDLGIEGYKKTEIVKTDSNDAIKIAVDNADDVKSLIYKNILKTGGEEDVSNILKDVSDQWHDEGTRSQTERDFGLPIVEAAKKLFPQESQKSLSIPTEENKKSEPIDVSIENKNELKDVESTAKALLEFSREYVNTDKNIKKHDAYFDLINDFDLKNKKGYIVDNISKAYHKAKADGSNPELVKAVESLLSKEQTQKPSVDVSIENKNEGEIARGKNWVTYTSKILDADGSINRNELQKTIDYGKGIENRSIDQKSVDFLKKINEKINDDELGATIDYLENILGGFKKSVAEVRKRAKEYSAVNGIRIGELGDILKGFDLEKDGKKAITTLFNKVYDEIGNRFIKNNEQPNNQKLLSVDVSTVEGKNEDYLNVVENPNDKIKREGDELVKKQQKSIDEAKDDLDKVKNGDTETIPEGKSKEKPIGKYEEKAREIADKIKKADLPSWLINKDPNITKQGISGEDLQNALAEAVIKVGKLLDGTVELAEAIRRGADDLVDFYTKGLGAKNLKPDFEKQLREGFDNHYRENVLGEEPTKKAESVPPKPPVDKTFNPSDSESSQERVRGAYQHLINSDIPKEIKDKMEKEGIAANGLSIKYKISDNGEAQRVGKAMIQSFGVDEALKLARLRTFHPSVNSAVYSEAINEFYNKENSATSQKGKFENASRWADTYNEYAELLTGSGQFSQYAYNFYKTSPLGFILSAKQRLDERREYFLGKDAKSLKEAFEALKDLPEFQDMFSEEVREAAKKAKNEIKKENRQKIIDGWDKIKDSYSKNTYSSIVPVPPIIIKGAIEAMKQAHLLGFEAANIIKEGIKYINEKYKEGWDEKKFEKDFLPVAEKLVSETVTKKPSPDAQKKILDKWDKKLSKLEPSKRKELLSNVLSEIVKNGGMDLDKFKQMYADALGLPSLTPQMEAKLKELGTRLNEVDIAREKLDADQTPANLNAFLKAMKEGETASRQINDLLGEKGITLDRFLSIAKLNTLGLANLVVNPVFNVAYMPVRFLESMVKTGMDYGLKYAGFPTENGLYENTFYKQRGYLKGFGQGFVKSIINLYTGDNQFDYFQKATRQNIQPLESIKEIVEHYSGGKKLTTSELANAIMEGFPTMGGSAAIISRGLQVGDLPFRFAAERGEAESIAIQKGLTGIKKEAFIVNPDEASKERIKAAGERAVMAQDNMLTGALNSLSNYLKHATSESKIGKIGVGVSKVIGATTQPFLKIPLNSAMTAFELAVPEFSIAKGLYHAVTGNRKEALNSFSRAVVGYSLGMALSLIAKAGLVSGTDDDKEKVNASIYKGDYVGDNTLNYTGLKRWLRGGTPQYQDGDITVSLNWMGIPGAIMQMNAQKYDKMKPEDWDKEGYFANLWARMDGSFVNGLKNNVFGNTSTLLNAMDGGGSYYVNRWLRGSSNVLANAFEPNWMATASRISDKYKADYSAMGLQDQMAATFKERFWDSDDLPKQITVWGEKRTDAPKGTNPYLYYFADITKSRNVDIDDFGFNILALYNKTKDDSVIPERPQKTIRSNNQTIKLEPKAYEEFQILVGRNRKQLVKALMDNETYNDANDEQKTQLLKKQYQNGYQIGKAEFRFKHPDLFPQPK